MLGYRVNSWREYDPLPRYAAQLRLFAQVGCCRRIGIGQPKDTVRYGLQEPHPHVKYRRRDLVVVVETTKHESFFRQITFGPRRRTLRDLARGFFRMIGVGLERVGQPYDLLRVELEMLLRNNGPIADDIVHPTGAHCA